LQREGMDIIKNHIQNVGIFEGIPYRIETNTGQAIEMYVDLTDNYEEQENQVQVTIKRRKAINNFRDNADGLTFELLKTKGVNFTETLIYYYVTPDNQLELFITLSLATYVMVKELITAGKEFLDTVNDIILAVTPSVGVGIVMDTGDIIVLVLRAVYRLIMFGLILVAIINLAGKLFVALFPPRRKGKGVKIKELLEKGCQYLGYQFESSIFDLYPDYTILPVPLIRERKSAWHILPEEILPAWQKGYPTASDTTPTLGSLIQAIETIFNAKTKIFNNIVKIERRDYWMNQISTQLLPALNIQGNRDYKKKFNAEEIWKRYYIKYQLDYSDTFTLDAQTYDNHDAEYSTEALSTINSDLITIKGLQEVSVPFSLGARKNELTWFEELAKGFLVLIDTVTGIFGGGTNYGQTIENRKGYLLVSANFWSITKLLWVQGDRQPANYFNFVASKNLWAKFHSINDIRQNAFEIIENAPVQINDNDFVNLQDNNFINFDGVDCEILRIEYFDETSTATISYQKPSNYAQNKVEVLTINE